MADDPNRPPLSDERDSSPTLTHGASGDADALFGRALESAGVLRPEQLAEARREQAEARAQGREERLVDVLVRKGLVTSAQFLQFIENGGVPRVPSAMHRTEITRESGSGTRVTPEGIAFGRYRLLEEVGRGGMGRVWKAWDGELQRIVALKQILPSGAGDRDQVERFAREARVAARLRHPHIVTVHDVGQIEGVHYFTGEFIQGRSLSAIKKGPVTAKQAAMWIKEAAEALACAHESGVIHRDVKPGNLLVNEQGRAFLTDFGLARDVHASTATDGERLTLTGALLGTPLYMSPEHAAGRMDLVGPASDQFSLGVVLYELLTKRMPFEGTGLRMLLNAISEREPVRPSRIEPRIHRDLDTICARTLEKAPAKRYPTMGALAADLGRYLDGEAIEARPVGALERLGRFTVRRWRLVAPLAAVILAATAIALSSVTQVNSAQEALRKGGLVSAVMARWGALADPVRRLEAAYTDARIPGAAKVEAGDAGWGAVERFMRETPPDQTSQAVMFAFAGWARRLAGRESEGIAWMRRAGEMDPDVPYGYFMEALANFSVYVEQQRMPDVTSSSSGIQIGRPLGEAAGTAELRAQIERLLARASSAPVWGKERAGEFRLALDAMAAWQRGDYPGAEAALTQALGSADLRAFAVGLRLARGKVRYFQKRFEAGLEDLDFVVQARPGQADPRRTLGLLREGAAVERSGRGDDPRPGLQDAFAAFAVAAALEPNDSTTHNQLGLCRWALAEAEDMRGIDPLPSHLLALFEFTASVRLHRSNGTALGNLGSCAQRIGRILYLRGADPRAWLGLACAACTAAIRIEPQNDMAYRTRALVFTTLAEFRSDRGGDGRPECLTAIADAEVTLRSAAEDPGILSHLGCAYAILGKVDAARGRNPEPAYRQDIDLQTRTLARDGGSVPAWSNRASAYGNIGEWQSLHGIDPRESYRASERDSGEALARSPNSASDYVNRAWARQGLAHADGVRGGDPRKGLLDAIADATRALELKGDLLSAYHTRGRARQYLAMQETAAGRDPRPPLREALADYDALLAANRTHLFGLVNRANVLIELADADAIDGSYARAYVDRAIADLDELLRRNSACVDGCLSRGRAHSSIGNEEARHGQDSRDRFVQAMADDDAALRLDPSRADAWCNRGIDWLWIGTSDEGRNLDPRASYEKAIEDFSAALRCDPRMAVALLNRGNAILSLGFTDQAHGIDPRPRFNQALADFEASLSMDPNRADTWFARGFARISHARWENDPRASVERGLADLEEAMTRRPRYWQAHAVKGNAYDILKDPSRAMEEYDAALKIHPDDPKILQYRAEAMLRFAPPQGPDAWLAELSLGGMDSGNGDYRSGRVHYERGLALLDGLNAEERAAQVKDPRAPGAIERACYNLACMYALLSVGREGPALAPTAVGPEDAAQARDAAFRYLARAIDSGWNDAKTTAEDPDLTPLRSDPRWCPLMERMEK